MDADKLLQELTTEEKTALASGTDFMYTNPVPRLGIKSVCMSDGPHGLRKQTGEQQDNGVSESEPATAFPSAVTTASGWDPQNTYKMGEAIAEECLHYGVNILLGPGTNIKRNPLCGRNFEYFSEDPVLAGAMAAGEVKGVQSKGVGVSVKHFALNNSENYRFMGDSIADERTIREIYLKPFEIVVKDSRPATLMCAYNKINGTYCGQNKWLLTDVLRTEWGYDGAVMTDWGATHDRAAMLSAGLDIDMPGDCAICRKWIMDGLKDGTLAQKDLDKAARNVLNLVDRYGNAEPGAPVDWEGHHCLTSEIASECAVLLKNDGSLPLSKDAKLCVIGDLFSRMRYQGAGSSMIHSTKVTTTEDAFRERGIRYTYARGYAENKTDPDQALIDEAFKTAEGYDTVLLFAGLTDYVEGEGADRETMSLPANQLACADALVKAGKKIILVLFGGSVIELPFEGSVSAILNMFLPGQDGGTACADLLFGDKNPCGRLAETWVKSYADVPFGDAFGKCANEVYKESVYVGYRYYLTAGKEVRYPFGYGLSYTTFAYKSIEITDQGDKVQVSCEVSNTGRMDGKEVVQMYVKGPDGKVFRPLRELKAFTKVALRAGESKTVTLSVDKEDLRYYDTAQGRYILEPGLYEFQICMDCETPVLSIMLNMEGEDVPSPYGKDIMDIYSGCRLDEVTDDVFERMSGQKIPALPPVKPIRLESRFTDLKSTFMGRILFNAVLGVANKSMKKAMKMPEGPDRDNGIKGAIFLKRILESNSVITMSMSAGKTFPYNFAEGFVALSNWHLLHGIKCFCTKIKAPSLPKDIKAEKG